jgi:hypothetical protein
MLQTKCLLLEKSSCRLTSEVVRMVSSEKSLRRRCESESSLPTSQTLFFGVGFYGSGRSNWPLFGGSSLFGGSTGLRA